MHGMPSHLRSAAAVLAVFALLVAGCSSKDDKPELPTGPLPDAAALLQKSAQTTRELTSAHLELTIEGTIEELPVKSLTGDLTNTPDVRAKGNVVLSDGDAAAEFVVIAGDLYAALDPGRWIPFGKAASIYDPGVILNPDNGVANVLANFTDPKAEGRELVGDVQTVKITGVVSAEAFDKIAQKVNAAGPVQGTAWIREDGKNDLVQAKLEPTPGNSIQMTLSKWNEPVTVDKPPGV